MSLRAAELAAKQSPPITVRTTPAGLPRHEQGLQPREPGAKLRMLLNEGGWLND